MSQTSLDLGFKALERTATAEDHRAVIARLVPLAVELAHTHAEGITVGDLRDAGVRAGILAAHAQGRALSFLGAVMRAAKLRPIAEYRRSNVPQSHGNLHRVWRLA